MLKPAARPLTTDDFRQLPEGPPYYQLIEGELFMSPSPIRYHQDILQNACFHLRGYLERNPIGTIHIAPSDVELSDLNVYEPDLYFVSNRRKSILTKQGAAGAPNMVLEILSPRTAKLDKGVKKDIYARTGVEELWIADPSCKELSIFVLQESTEQPKSVFKGRQKVVSSLFPSLDLTVSALFRA